jgi:hypothetical protein
MFLVIYFPADDHFFRLAIDLSALLAVGTLFLAIRTAAYEDPESSGTEPFVGGGATTMPDGPVVIRRPSPVSAPPRAPRIPVPTSVPRFGAGSKAQRFPWLLPLRPASSGVAGDEALLGDLAVRAASLVGPGHRCQEPATARQDAYRMARDETGEHLLLAVADGVSSSTHAELGATVAASTAINHLKRQLDDSEGQLSSDALFEEVAVAMRREAARRGLAPTDVCAVLLVAVIPTRPTAPSGERTMWAAWLGDASLWRLAELRWRHAVGDRKGGVSGYDSNAVPHTLPGDPHAARESRLALRPGDVVSLVSDGVGDGLATIDDLNAYLADRWQKPLPITTYLNDIGFDAERFLDDRTSVTVWVAPGSRPRRTALSAELTDGRPS